MAETLFVLLTFAGILAAFIVAAVLREDKRVQIDKKTVLPPGKQIDWAGSLLHVYGSGAGTPAVVLDAGLGDSCLVWSYVQPEVAVTTRVISYDRAGVGWSDPGLKPRTYQRAADELHAVLKSCGEEGPYVLVGHSAGVNSVRLFAQSYPEDVAGLVLLEPPLLSRAGVLIIGILCGMRYAVYVLSKFGIVRLLGKKSKMRLLFGGIDPPVEISKLAGFLYRPESIRASIDEIIALPESICLLNRSVCPGAWRDWPVVIISARTTDKLNMQAEQPFRDLASLSTQGRIIRVKGSHFVHFEHADIVIGTIQEVVSSIRRINT